VPCLADIAHRRRLHRDCGDADRFRSSAQTAKALPTTLAEWRQKLARRAVRLSC
jgi:hypothetical protein